MLPDLASELISMAMEGFEISITGYTPHYVYDTDCIFILVRKGNIYRKMQVALSDLHARFDNLDHALVEVLEYCRYDPHFKKGENNG